MAPMRDQRRAGFFAGLMAELGLSSEPIGARVGPTCSLSLPRFGGGGGLGFFTASLRLERGRVAQVPRQGGKGREWMPEGSRGMNGALAHRRRTLALAPASFDVLARLQSGQSGRTLASSSGPTIHS